MWIYINGARMQMNGKYSFFESSFNISERRSIKKKSSSISTPVK